MKPIIIAGKTPDEKFKSIENILGKIIRRSRKHTVVVMPAIPLFFQVDVVPENGVIFEWLFPTNGVVTKVCLAIKEFAGKDAVKFVVNMTGSSGGAFRSFETRKPLIIEEINLPVSAGSRLMFQVSDPEMVRGIWVSFLFEMGIRDAGKETFIIEELERLIEGDFEEVENG